MTTPACGRSSCEFSSLGCSWLVRARHACIMHCASHADLAPPLPASLLRSATSHDPTLSSATTATIQSFICTGLACSPLLLALPLSPSGSARIGASPPRPGGRRLSCHLCFALLSSVLMLRPTVPPSPVTHVQSCR